MQNATALVMLSIVLLFSSGADAQRSMPEDGVIPVKLYSGYLVIVRGSIGKLEKRNLAIDTGAYPSIVDGAIARKLRLSGHEEELRVVDHNIITQALSVPSLHLGPILAENLRVVVQDLTPLSQKFGVRIDALIGMDVLARSSFQIDYREKKMSFGPVNPWFAVVPLRWKASMVCVDLKLNGQPAQLLVDTGAANVLLFARRLPWLDTQSGTIRASSNLGGNIVLRQVKMSSLQLGDADLGPRDLFISETQNMSPFPFDGLLATGALPFRKIAFDFERQLFGWEPATGRTEAQRASLVSAAPPTASPFPSSSPFSGNFANSTTMGLCATDPLHGAGCSSPVRVRKQDD
jgi:predicted aspartyl protease